MKKASGHPSYPPFVLARIRRLRKKHGFSQKTVAACLGVRQQTYSCYERGVTEMHIEHFRRLAKLYDVSVDFITGVSNIMGTYPKM